MYSYSILTLIPLSFILLFCMLILCKYLIFRTVPPPPKCGILILIDLQTSLPSARSVSELATELSRSTSSLPGSLGSDISRSGSSASLPSLTASRFDCKLRSNYLNKFLTLRIHKILPLLSLSHNFFYHNTVLGAC